MVVVQVGPHLRGALHGPLSCHPDDAARSASAAGLFESVEGDSVEVWIGCVVAVLVVDGKDIAGLAPCQPLAKRTREDRPLFGGGLQRQSDDEALGSTPFPPLGVCFCRPRGIARRRR